MAWRGRWGLSKFSASTRSSLKDLAATSPTTARGVTSKADVYTRQQTSDDILQIKNGEVLYAGLTSKELLSTLFNLQMAAFEPVVDVSVKVLTSPLMKSALVRAPVLQVVKRTAYSHFCAGEDLEEASKTLHRMWELGLYGIIDYGLEDATDRSSCNGNLESFKQVVQQTSQLPQGSVSAIKVGSMVLSELRLSHRAPV